jgi:hypothetical protein
MKYKDIVLLKRSLRSKEYRSSKGHALYITIAPANENDLKLWKSKVPEFWYGFKDLDLKAKGYTSKDDFILFGVREVSHGVFAGGPLDLDKHPELYSSPKYQYADRKWTD